MAAKVKVDQADFEHGWGDNSGRFPLDALLREHGWRIVSRMKGKDAVWEKGKEVLPMKKALRLLERSKVRDAEYAEMLREDETAEE